MSLRKLMDDLDALDPDAQPEQQDDPEGPEEVEPESPPAEDDPTEDPDDEGEAEDESPDDGASDDAEDAPEETEPQGDEEDEDAEPVYEIDGKQVPLSEVLEWRDGRNELKATLTRATQAAAQRERELKAQVAQANEGSKAQQKLVADLTSDATVRKFLQKHPDALTLMLEVPDEARKLIGDPQKMTAFWEDYETLKDNPRLAERLAGQQDPAPEEVSEELVHERNQRIVQGVWQGVQQAIEHIAEERGIEADDDKQAIAASVWDMLGMPTDGSITEDQLLQGTTRALQMMFRNDPEQGIVLDRKLLDDRFDVFEAKKSVKKKREDKQAEAHNAEVDKALKDADKPPKTPGGDAPAAEPETVPEIKGGIRGVMDAIDSYNPDV